MVWRVNETTGVCLSETHSFAFVFLLVSTLSGESLFSTSFLRGNGLPGERSTMTMIAVPGRGNRQAGKRGVDIFIREHVRESNHPNPETWHRSKNPSLTSRKPPKYLFGTPLRRQMGRHCFRNATFGLRLILVAALLGFELSQHLIFCGERLTGERPAVVRCRRPCVVVATVAIKGRRVWICGRYCTEK
jgi:hypothetical protein